MTGTVDKIVPGIERRFIMSSKNSSLLLHRQRDTRRVAAVFLAPVSMILLVFIVYPIISTFVTSFYKWDGISADKIFNGFDNWITISRDVSFWIAFMNNIIIMVLSIAIQLPIAMALATLLEFTGKKLNIAKVIWFIPLLMSSVAVGFLFKYALATNGGIVSTISQFFGGKNIDLLGNKNTALVTVIMVICWQFIPFYMVYFIAAYTNISVDVFEAARIDGANRGQYFRKIALPLLTPAIKSAMILSMVGSLKYFDLIYVMTGGGPGTSTELMATYMYKQSFKTYNMGYGSTVASGMFILITCISLLTMKLLNRNKEE
jgi:raffinose/stachyose/melibiose transport system permease protein